MIDMILGGTIRKSAQKYIDKLTPKVNIHVPDDLPLPSVALLKKMAAVVSVVNGYEDALSKLSDEQLQQKTPEFKARYQQGVAKELKIFEEANERLKNTFDEIEKQSLTIELEKAQEDLKKKKAEALEAILPEAFAVVRETGKRMLSMRHFDVQMAGGIVLHNGNIAEMTTGEGKTLMATLPAYLNALTGEGVHVVTVNDYLASRDREWMGPIFEFLGLTIGVIQHDMNPTERQQSYACDIVYGTNNEFGFDYLRDNMVNSVREIVQRKHHFAVVDEVDSILIDEARTPLIISGPAEESTDKYYTAYQISQKLKGKRITDKDEINAKHQNINLGEGVDYLADEKSRAISLTDAGEEKAAKLFNVANLHDMENVEHRHHVLQALKAKEFFVKDVEYVMRDGQVIIVDEFTGRLMPGRRWSDGLHQAVEAKEGIKIERENQTLATITFQNYFKLYEKLSGMTGTAETEANEFKQIYKLDVVVVPTNKRLQRKNFPDSIYKTVQGKYNAVADDIEECHKRGQPVLVGTISIEKSEILSRLLKSRGVAHHVLNAKYHEQEANIIAQAGRYKAVTIATNMAGRGTDIVLGGNATLLARNLAVEKGKDVKDDAEKDEMIKKFITQFREQCKKEQAQVIEQGGLHVIGTERHESRRIDNQLRGRQGRQGDPGSSRFYISLEDDLMRLFASDNIIGLMNKMGMEENQVLEHPLLNRALENAQKRVETHNFEIRKHLLEYDNVMNRQREVVYSLRRQILESDEVKNIIIEYIQQFIAVTVEDYLFTKKEEQTFDTDGLILFLNRTFDYALPEDLKARLPDLDAAQISEEIFNDIKALYEAKDQEIDPRALRHMEKMFLLHTIDSKWKDHLYAMDQLKEGIGLRSFAQRDPLIEYKREGFVMFQGMYDSIYFDVSQMVFKIKPAQNEKRLKSVFSSIPQRMVHDEISSLRDIARQSPSSAPAQENRPAQQPSSPAPVRHAEDKVGRNDPCPCGSGKKYKKCCGA